MARVPLEVICFPNSSTDFDTTWVVNERERDVSALLNNLCSNQLATTDETTCQIVQQPHLCEGFLHYNHISVLLARYAIENTLLVHFQNGIYIYPRDPRPVNQRYFRSYTHITTPILHYGYINGTSQVPAYYFHCIIYWFRNINTTISTTTLVYTNEF